MIPYLGDYAEDSTIYLMFNTFTSDDPSASCTITNLLNTDVHIHKDDGLTQRNNAAGITVSVDFDGITGSHLLKIDSSDDTVSGFWVKAHDYFVRIEGTTVDAATINSVVCHFSIENRYMRGTESANTAVPPTASEINDEMVDVMTVDTTAEPTQGAPPETPTFQEIWAYIYFRMRNKCETTSTEDAVFNNAGTTKLFKATISDNGTTFSKAEYESGV